MSGLIGNVNDSSGASGAVDGAVILMNVEVADGGSVTVGDKVVVNTAFIELYIRPITGPSPIVVKIVVLPMTKMLLMLLQQF